MRGDVFLVAPDSLSRHQRFQVEELLKRIYLLLWRSSMPRLARLAALICFAITPIPLLSQTQPAPSQAAPQPVPAPAQPTPTDPTQPQPAAQPTSPQQPMPPEQTAPPAKAQPQATPQAPQQPAPVDQPPAQPPVQQPQPVPQPTPAPAPRNEAIAKKSEKKDSHQPVRASEIHHPVLWHDPGDIASKNLLYGPGGGEGQPKPPFVFVDEDMHDSNPKFDVRDADDREWRVKLGAEAKPEIVASRLLWAVGYYANVDYVLHVTTIENLHIKRGKDQVHNGDQVIDVRFARKPDGDKKLGTWEWKKNPFLGTREFNGLRVMMAVLNSWDLKDENNAIYHDKKTGEQLFLVSDIGATFGTNELHAKNVDDKGNVGKYVQSKFIVSQNGQRVSFGTPAPPTGLMMESGGILAPIYFKRLGFDWIGKDIPVEDARWIGSLLAQLSHQQLVDAFTAANFTPEQIDQYVAVVEQRIAQLKAL
jgi:hypothetical protein